MKELIEELQNIQLEIESLENKIKEKIGSINDIVKEVALYIKIKGYPTEIYLIYNSDFEIYDSYKDVELKIMKSYGYTDIVGLTREEFTRLKKLLEEQ